MDVSCEDLEKLPRGPEMTVEAVHRMKELRESNETDGNLWSVFG